MKRRPLYALACAVVISGCSTKKPTTTNGADAAASSTPAPAATLIYDAGVLNATTMPTAYIQKGVNPQHLPAYNGPTGSVEGIIRKNGPPAPSAGLSPATFAQCPSAQQEYGTTFREGPPDSAGRRAVIDAVVVVRPAARSVNYFVPEKNAAVKVSIEDCGYSQRSIVLTLGQYIEVKNNSKEFWVPMLNPNTGVAMMMAAPNGADPVKVYPKEAGRYQLVDHDRKYVINDVYVVLQPLHAVTDANGHYRIDGIPVGAMKIAASHPQMPERIVATSELDVRENAVTTVDLTMNYVPPEPKDAGGDSGFVPYPGLH